ncbi:tRNA-dihydrouridine synthase [Planctomycetales bacterium 10988]|nr:tRNA-dihydrouridine synthase [Planctomycetales bacterium 10988]
MTNSDFWQLPQLRLGDLELDFPVVQAALSGYSDGPMRLLARRLGASYALCEVMLDQMVLTCGKKTRRMMQVSDEEQPVGGQLMGSKPEDFGPAAMRLVEAGFRVIDINFGCPVKKVLGRCRGGYLLSQPEIALEIVSRVRDAVPAELPVTVKMRKGMDDTNESKEKFFTILDGAFARGVAAVTVHGRSVQQRYIGPSNWNFLKEVKEFLGERTLLGSGDLFSAEDCLRMMQETGVDGVTVARGAIGNPWIFREARALAAGKPLPAPPTVYEQREVISEHYRLADEYYGEDRGNRIMRKFGIKYAQLHPDPIAVRDAFVRIRHPGSWQKVIEQWYSEDRPGLRPSPPTDLGCGVNATKKGKQDNKNLSTAGACSEE